MAGRFSVKIIWGLQGHLVNQLIRTDNATLVWIRRSNCTTASRSVTFLVRSLLYTIAIHNITNIDTGIEMPATLRISNEHNSTTYELVPTSGTITTQTNALRRHGNRDTQRLSIFCWTRRSDDSLKVEHGVQARRHQKWTLPNTWESTLLESFIVYIVRYIRNFQRIHGHRLCGSYFIH